MKNIAFILFMVSLTLWAGTSGSAETVTLLTEEQAAMADPPSGVYEAGRVLNTGPVIEIITPEGDKKYKAPVKIVAKFIPKDGKEVDLSGFKVECLKIFTIDLTDKVMPYTTKDGINIEKADLPPGKFKIRVTLADVEGGVTQEIFVVRVT